VALRFDPYHRWLGIPAEHQPPDHYRLLGLEPLESDPEVIRDAAERQMAHVRTYQLGPHSQESQKILNELGAAKACLLDPAKKGPYDRQWSEGAAGDRSPSGAAGVAPAVPGGPRHAEGEPQPPVIDVPAVGSVHDRITSCVPPPVDPVLTPPLIPPPLQPSSRVETGAGTRPAVLSDSRPADWPLPPQRGTFLGPSPPRCHPPLVSETWRWGSLVHPRRDARKARIAAGAGAAGIVLLGLLLWGISHGWTPKPPDRSPQTPSSIPPPPQASLATRRPSPRRPASTAETAGGPQAGVSPESRARPPMVDARDTVNRGLRRRAPLAAQLTVETADTPPALDVAEWCRLKLGSEFAASPVIAYSPDGRLVAVAAEYPSRSAVPGSHFCAQVVDLGRKQVTCQVRPSAGPNGRGVEAIKALPFCLCVTNQGRSLLVGPYHPLSAPRPYRLISFDISANKYVGAYLLDEEQILGSANVVGFSGDGRFAVFWCATSGQKPGFLVFDLWAKSHDSFFSVSDPAIGDQRTIVHVGGRGRLFLQLCAGERYFLWDVATDRRNPVDGPILAFSGDGQRFLSGNGKGAAAEVRNTADTGLVSLLENDRGGFRSRGPVDVASLDEDGSLAWAFGALWRIGEPSKPARRKSLDSATANSGAAIAARFSPDGQWLAVCYGNPHNRAAGTELAVYQISRPQPGPFPPGQEASAGPVR
jgi:hypothetical protein